MNDPALNSMHLDLSRREQFRRARQALVDACGAHTMQIDLRPHLRRAAAGDILADRLLAADDESATPFVLEGGERRHPLRIGINSLGRLDDNDVVLADPHVSRRHCAILVHASRACEVQDTASKNGTYVNGHRIDSPTRLQPGDEIRVCHWTLVLRERRPDDSPDADPR